MPPMMTIRATPPTVPPTMTATAGYRQKEHLKQKVKALTGLDYTSITHNLFIFTVAQDNIHTKH